jgi:hypothetical protein
MPSSTVPYQEGLVFGVGVDTPSGDARSIAVTGSPNAIPQAPGPEITFTMTEVTSVEDLTKTLGISADASGGVGLFSASARMDFAQSCHINTSSVFACFSIKRKNAFQQIDAPGISDAANSLLENGQITSFQNEFGDMFVRGLETGGQFFGVIEITCSDQDDQQSMSIAVKGAFGPFGAGGSFSQSFKDTVSKKNISIQCHVEGGRLPDGLPTNLDSLVAAAKDWPNTVDANAVPYAALLDSYSILPLPNPPNYIDLAQQKDVLALCAQQRNQHWVWINDITYILAHPEQFVTPDLELLGKTQVDLEADLTTIADAASNALNNPKSAAAPTALKVTAVQLPARIQKAQTDLSIYLGDWFNADQKAELAELIITRVDDTRVDVAANFPGKPQVRATGAWDDSAKALTVTLMTDPGASGGGIMMPGTSHSLAITKTDNSATQLGVIDNHGSALDPIESVYTFQTTRPV